MMCPLGDLQGGNNINFFRQQIIRKFILLTFPDSHNYNNKLIYDAFIEIQTKDSLNLGLKKILKQTDNWIFNHPLADLYINDKKITWLKGYKKLKKTQPDLIYRIDLFDKTSDNKKSGRDKIKVKIKNE